MPRVRQSTVKYYTQLKGNNSIHRMHWKQHQLGNSTLSHTEGSLKLIAFRKMKKAVVWPASFEAEEDPEVAEEHQQERQAVLEEQQRGHIGKTMLIWRPQLHTDQMVPETKQRRGEWSVQDNISIGSWSRRTQSIQLMFYVSLGTTVFCSCNPFYTDANAERCWSHLQ